MATAANPVTRYTDYGFDFVASGCVWSGDAYGATRVASMTAGVVYINGVRIVVSAVTSRTFTASRDTYIDIDSNGTIGYSEVTNNAASPALAANSIRLGIIVTGASTIANVGSVNQGQEDNVLPIVSSVAYAVTDSLGNLICPRDPKRRVLGYRQWTSNVLSSSTTVVQVTGLSAPVIVPTGRKVIVSAGSYNVQSNTADRYSFMEVWDGTVGSGTLLASAQNRTAQANTGMMMFISGLHTPTSASKTYNVGLYGESGATINVAATATRPSYIRVELA